MSTTERELTEPVDLCLEDGLTLRPDAVGWSRRPLHRANLAGRWGRTKRWEYWALLADEVVVALTYADVDYLGIVAVWWYERASGRSGGREIVVPFARGITLPDLPGAQPLTFSHHHLGVGVVDDAEGTSLTVRWRERDGRLGRLDARVALPPGHESVNLVVPWSKTRFQYTSKHQARPATASLRLGEHQFELGGEDRPAWGVLDVGRGRWPYRTRWNWGGGAGITEDGRTVGIQLGGRWTAGTGVTENGIIVDGQVLKLGDELHWQYDWERPLDPWWVASPDGRLDLTLLPDHDRHARTQALVLATEVHQVFGRWSGQVPAHDGTTVTVDGLLGFAEESRSRW